MRLVSRNAIKRALLGVHKAGIRLGIHVLPVHYYSPLPNILELRRTQDVWAKRSELPGLHIDLDQQAATLRAACSPYQSEYAGNAAYREGMSGRFGPGYGYVEAQALHGFIRHFKPRRIVEVGSGVSTWCMVKAAERNAREGGQAGRITSIEPFPSTHLRSLREVDLVPLQVQTVPLEVFTELGENDVLFIDSSHTVKPGGDVNYLILEVLPRLRPGVIVHFHDIFLPYDYQRDVCQSFLHWSETSLLRAYLAFNDRVKLLVCMSHLHYDRKEVLREVFPEYEPQADANGLRPESARPFEQSAQHFPSSTWLQIR